MILFQQRNTMEFLNKRKNNFNYETSKKQPKLQKSMKNPLSIEANLNLLKTLVFSSENIESIKSALAETVEHRAQMIKDAKLDFLEQFPTFFTNPELVCLPHGLNFCTEFLLI